MGVVEHVYSGTPAKPPDHLPVKQKAARGQCPMLGPLPSARTCKHQGQAHQEGNGGSQPSPSA